MASLKLRGKTYYVQWYEDGKVRRKSLQTDSLQIAKERKRQFESAQFRGEASPLPSRTPVGEVVAAYIEHTRVRRPESSWKRDLSYLRAAFGECCSALELNGERARKCREVKLPEDKRRKLWPIGANHFEAITPAMISEFLAAQVRAKGLAPKTANRYREVVGKVIAWAMRTERVQMPQDRNPIDRVDRYRERASEISFLSLEQIAEQLAVLKHRPLLHPMVATLIYAGLRREELLWLQTDDLVAPTAQAPNGLLRIRAKTVGEDRWQPKTATNRVVPISRELRAVFDDYAPDSSEGGWLFPSATGVRWDPDNFSRALRRANSNAGLSWTCLEYRHTFGSQLAQKGESLYHIAKLMGNSPFICQKHYAALVPERLSSIVDFGSESA